MADAFAAADMIAARLRAAWTATPADRLRFDDNGPLIDMEVLAPFCQAEIAWGEDRPYAGAASSRLNRIDGVLMLHFMAPRQDGVSAIRAMHADARRALANATWQADVSGPIGVYMAGLSPNRGRPASDDGSYFGTSAAIPFFAIYRET